MARYFPASGVAASRGRKAPPPPARGSPPAGDHTGGRSVPRNRPEPVTIAGEVFELGAVYAPRNGMGNCRLLLAYEPDGEWLGGKVVTWRIGRTGGRPPPRLGRWGGGRGGGAGGR